MAKIKYKSTPEDIAALKIFMDTAEEEEISLKLDMMNFFMDWIVKRHRKMDAHYHNSIYNFLVLIGHRPKQQTKTQGETE